MSSSYFCLSDDYYYWTLFCVSAGTIGSEPEPIESRQFKDKLATAGVFGTGNKDKTNDTTYPLTPQPPGSTVSPHPPATDENIIFGEFLCQYFSLQ